MENARDTFYIALRGRLAAINPTRTIVVRGLVRPGVLVEENELATTSQLVDAFTLRWTSLTVNTAAALPFVTMECQIRYATDGSVGLGGMDRGRLLAAMDGELTAALTQSPQSTPKMSYSDAGAVPMATNIFWGQPQFSSTTVVGERVERIATVQVFSYQEAGEL